MIKGLIIIHLAYLSAIMVVGIVTAVIGVFKWDIFFKVIGFVYVILLLAMIMTAGIMFLTSGL